MVMRGSSREPEGRPRAQARTARAWSPQREPAPAGRARPRSPRARSRPPRASALLSRAGTRSLPLSCHALAPAVRQLARPRAYTRLAAPAAARPLPSLLPPATGCFRRRRLLGPSGI